MTLLSLVQCLPLWAQERPQVVVVGGGIAGLVTAYKLEQRGYRCCLLEGSDRLGGRIGTAHYPGGLEAEYRHAGRFGRKALSSASSKNSACNWNPVMTRGRAC